MDKSQRIQFKSMICILGIMLLVILFGTAMILISMKKDPVHIPVVRELPNVWVMEVGDSFITVFEDGNERTYLLAEGYTPMQECREQVADITLTDDRVSQICCKIHKINGRVLAADENGVEIEGVGYLLFTPDVRGYRLYDTLVMSHYSDLKIGYDFADFVIENQKICGILQVKEAAMKSIRVLIRTNDFKSVLHDTLEISCDTDYIIEYGPYGERMNEYHRAGEVCEIHRDRELFLSNRIRIVPAVLTGKVILNSVSRNQGTPAYRGIIEVLRTEDGLAVVNEVTLEEYLYSVVPSEMPSSYPAEALKAQAISARTYAYRRMLHAGLAKYGAHVDDSTGYQVYNNIPEQEATTTAVKETYGQILFEPGGNMPAEIYYYSTSCGMGTDGDIWNTEPGESPDYLIPRPISRMNDWDNREDTDLMAESLKEEDAFRKFILSKNEKDYEVSEHGYRWSYTVSMLDTELLCERLSQRYKVNPERVLTLNEEGEFESKPLGDWNSVLSMKVASRGAGGVVSELIIETDEDTYKVLTEYNIRYVLCDTFSKVKRQNGGLVDAATLVPSGYFVMDQVKEGDLVTGYVLHGGGYGHGVGMSQNGAKHMAADGMTAAQILTFFYQGCLIQGIYQS